MTSDRLLREPRWLAVLLAIAAAGVALATDSATVDVAAIAVGSGLLGGVIAASVADYRRRKMRSVYWLVVLGVMLFLFDR